MLAAGVLLLVAGATATRAQTSFAFDCATADSVAVELPPYGEKAPLHWTDARPGTLTLDERGVDVVVKNIDAAGVTSIDAPPRLGFHVIELSQAQSVELSRLRPAGLPGKIVARVRCDEDEKMRVEKQWIDRVRAAVAASAEADTRESAMNDLARLAGDAPTPALRALALHLSAQAMFRAGQSNRAFEGFVVAEAAWRAAGDPVRALAARVGQVDERFRLGQFRQAVGAAANAASFADVSPYYSLRLATTRCLSLRHLAALGKADRCYEAAIASFDAAGEFAEVASARQDHADVAYLLGRLERAIALNQGVLELAQGPDEALLRGRAHLSLSTALLATAEISKAIDESRLALAEFDAIGASRWSANALVRTAHIYAALGASGDARDAIGQALARYDKADAPTRIAAAKFALARVALQDDRIDEAAAALGGLEAFYAQQGMDVDRDRVRVELLRIAILRDDRPRVAALRRMLQTAKPDDPDRLLAIVAAYLSEGDGAAASATLASLRARGLSLTQTIEQARLMAGIEFAAGRHANGRALLARSRAGLDRVVARLSNPLLRTVLSNRIADVGRDAIDSIRDERRQETPGVTDAAASLEVWAWLTGAALASEAPPDKSRDAAGFNRAVAAQIVDKAALTTARAERASPSVAAHRELLSALTRRGSAARLTASLQIDELQRTLADGEWFVAHADGRRGGLLLAISRNSVRLVDVPGAAELRVQAGRLIDAAVGEVPAQVDRLGAELASLLHLDALGPPPRRLVVHRDGVLGGVPWNLVVWPGTHEPLVTTTTTVVSPLSPLRETDAWQRPERLVVFVAEGGDETAPLPYAAIEPRLVRKALGSAIPDVRELEHAGRDDFLRELSTQGLWLHVGAHGTAQPGRIGRSGLLLGAGGSQYVSWLDVAGVNNRAALVVLAACDAGSGYDTALNNLGFAAGLSRSGVSNVVAALWQASDPAVPTWVTAFYGALAADPTLRPADALRTAVLELRSSPHFRDPRYWGSLIAIERRAPAAVSRP